MLVGPRKAGDKAGVHVSCLVRRAAHKVKQRRVEHERGDRDPEESVTVVVKPFWGGSIGLSVIHASAVPPYAWFQAASPGE